MSEESPVFYYRRRKDNYSIDEIRVLLECYKERRAEVEGIINLGGSRHHLGRVWDCIYKRFRQSFPDTERTAWNIRKKVSRLKSDTKQELRKEWRKAKAKGVDIATVWKTVRLTPANELMFAELPEDFPMEEYENEPDRVPFVEYEIEFDGNEVTRADATERGDEESEEDEGEEAGMNHPKRPKTVNGEGEAGNEDDNDSVVGNLSSEQILKNMMFPEHMAYKIYQANDGLPLDDCPRDTVQLESTSRAVRVPKMRQVRPRKRHAFPKVMATEQDVLELQKTKLIIERDNLLLAQKKLRLEVKLVEKQWKEARGKPCSNCGHCAKVGGGKSSSFIDYQNPTDHPNDQTNDTITNTEMEAQEAMESGNTVPSVEATETAVVPATETAVVAAPMEETQIQSQGSNDAALI